MFYKIAFFVLLVAVLGVIIIFGPRIRKDIQLKKEKTGVFAIQNVQTERCLRPYNAGFLDGTPVILYEHKDWECVTWHLIALGNNTYLLENLYTEKTFEPESEPAENVAVRQRPLGESHGQRWQLLKQDDGTFLIRLKDTEWYLTAENDEQNSPVVLRHLQESKAQKWRLIPQNPII